MGQKVNPTSLRLGVNRTWDSRWYADEKYADKGFQIISISIDKKKADWEKALQEEQLSWPNYLDNGDVAVIYKVKMIPTMYLINTNGIMVGENLRGEALAEKIEQLLGK